MIRRKDVVVLGKASRQPALEPTLEEQHAAKDKEAQDALLELFELHGRVWRLWLERAALEEGVRRKEEIRAGVAREMEASAVATRDAEEARNREALARKEAAALDGETEASDVPLGRLADLEQERDDLLARRAQAILDGRESVVAEVEQELREVAAGIEAIAAERERLLHEQTEVAGRRAHLLEQAERFAADAERLDAEAAAHRSNALSLPDDARRVAVAEQERVRRLLTAGPPKPKAEVLVFGSPPQIPDGHGYTHLGDGWVITPRGELVRVE